MTSPLSLSHNGRPALTNSTRSVEPPKASLWSEDGDDAATLQLLRPVSRPPQPVQLAHSLRASDEPPEAPASQLLVRQLCLAPPTVRAPSSLVQFSRILP